MPPQRLFECLLTALARLPGGQLFYSSTDAAKLLKGVQLNSIARRQDFFTRMSGCRRRYSRRWHEKPVAMVLRDFASEFDLLMQRLQAQAVQVRTLATICLRRPSTAERATLSTCMQMAIERKDLPFKRAFEIADRNKDGALSPEEVLRALLWLQVPTITHSTLWCRSFSADRPADRQLRQLTARRTAR